jgi:hypothetical protein
MDESIIPLSGVPVFARQTNRALTDVEREALYNLKEHPADAGTNYITSNRYLLNLPEFANLKSELKSHLDYYTGTVLQLRNNFVITNSWATRNPTGSVHHLHVHGNSIFSGIYYIDIEDGELELMLKPVYSNSYKFFYDIKEFNIFNSDIWKLKTTAGTIIIMPSDIYHRVSPNNSTSDRRIIGFNTFLSDQVGTIDAINLLTVKTL